MLSSTHLLDRDREVLYEVEVPFEYNEERVPVNEWSAKCIKELCGAIIAIG